MNTSAAIPIVIVTGLSGSGKSTALDVFEDIGFYRIDGLPSILMPSILEFLKNPGFAGSTGLILGVDLRQEQSIEEFNSSIKKIEHAGIVPYILFFEAQANTLLKRYATTRRPHPLEKEGLGLEQAIEIEKKRLLNIRQVADLVLDTSAYSIHDLRRTLQKKWSDFEPEKGPSLRVHILSFGFKYGVPSEADILIDLRFLPNPYFIEELKPLSGKNEKVATYVLESEQGKATYENLLQFLSFLLEQNEKEGRFRITIALGCTGGRHRSVANAEALANDLRKKQYIISLEHRHLELG